MAKIGNDLPVYVASDEFLAELRELGYDNIELDDLIDFFDEDPALIEQMRPTILVFDELNYVSPALAKFMYNRTLDGRPT